MDLSSTEGRNDLLAFEKGIPNVMVEALSQCVPFALTVVGAFALYILSRNRGIVPFSCFSALNISVGKRAKPSAVLLDSIVTSILGATIAYFATQPSTNAQAVAAGLSFTGIMNTLGNQNNE